MIVKVLCAVFRNVNLVNYFIMQYYSEKMKKNLIDKSVLT